MLIPQTTAASQAFTLTLKNPKFSCATAFSDQSARLTGNSLYLTFKAVTRTGVMCVYSDTLYGPAFQVQPLSAASYSVYAVQEPPCAPLCAVPVQQQFAGTLTVLSPGKDSGWFIQPKQTQENKPFTLQLLSYAYGNCQTTFTHTSLDSGDHSLYFNFVVENHPERMCVADIRPYGPSYPLSGLTAGKYPVYAVQHVACEYTNPRCLIAIRPTLADTLSVFIVSTQVLPRAPYIFHRFAPPDHLGTVDGYWIDGRKAVPNR